MKTSHLIIAVFYMGIVSNAQTVPIIRHPANSTLPDSIHVIGRIVDTPAMGMCGYVCLGGTLKVKLDERVLGYNSSFVYLVTACLGCAIPVDSKIDVMASKLTYAEKECYYNSIMNNFNSYGVPFYKLSEKETASICKALQDTIW